MFASEELHFDNKNRFTTFRKFAHPPKVVPHHAPYCLSLLHEIIFDTPHWLTTWMATYC